MYALDEFVDMGLADENQQFEWTSDAHRQVAINLCIGNPNIFDMDVLSRNTKIINAIPMDRIKKVTAQDIIDMGGTI
jgi:hypothetical protein